MKKLVLSMVLLAFAITATAQQMAKQQTESLTSYLSLDESQKEAVYQLYKAAEDQRNQKRQPIMAKQSDEVRAAREKAAKSKKTRPTPKSSGEARNVKAAMSASERFLMIAYRKAESDPALKRELQIIFTPQQASKWQQLGKK